MFDILDHLDKLENVEEYHTWIKASCPECGGKLKISKQNSSYACYTNLCHENKDSYGYNAVRRQLTPYSQRKQKLKRYTKIEIVTPNYFQPRKEDLYELSSNFYPLTSYTEKGNTVFPYKEFEAVRTPSKEIFLRHHKDTLGIPTKLEHPYIYPTNPITSKVVAVVEGEKCADVCTEHSMWAYTLPCFAYNMNGTNVLANVFKEAGVEKVIIFADNDIPGAQKASKIERALWSKGLATHLVVFDSYRQGYDIADYLQENSWTTLASRLLGEI